MPKRRRTRPVPMLLPQPAERFVGRKDELVRLVQALQPGRTVTLYGPPGIGKRSIAAAAIDRLAPGAEPPPAFPDGIVTLSCLHYASEILVLSALGRAFGQAVHPDPRAQICSILAGKRVLIVLEDVQNLFPDSFDASDYRVIGLEDDDAEQIAQPGDSAEYENADDEADGGADDGGADDGGADDGGADDGGADDEGEVEDASDALASLLALLGATQCGILLTTVDLNYAVGEVIELEPLGEQEGRMLLAVYAGDLAYSVEDSAQVVSRLGGVPLSLTLAAMWMATEDQPVAACRAALEAYNPPHLLPDAPGEAGIAAAFHLAVDALDEVARTALRLFGMLAPAPLPFPVLGAIISPTTEDDLDASMVHEGIKLLENLVEYGLLVPQFESLQYRHYLLHDLAAMLIREEDKEEAAAQSFAAHVADMVDTLMMFAEMAQEEKIFAAIRQGLHPHILAMQSALFSIGLWDLVADIAARTAGYFDASLYWYELFDLLNTANLAADHVEDPAMRSRYTMSLGLHMGRMGLEREAARSFAKALAAAEQSEEQMLIMNATEALLRSCSIMGDAAGARSYAERFLMLADQQGDPQLRALARVSMMDLLVEDEAPAADLLRALELAEQALQLHRQLDDQDNLLDDLLNIGAICQMLRDIPRSLEYGEQAVEQARRLRNRYSEAMALLNLGKAFETGGEPRRAMRSYEKALEVARRGNAKDLVAVAGWNLGASLELQGNLRAALKYYEQCLGNLKLATVRHPAPADVEAKIAALRAQIKS